MDLSFQDFFPNASPDGLTKRLKGKILVLRNTRRPHHNIILNKENDSWLESDYVLLAVEETGNCTIYRSQELLLFLKIHKFYDFKDKWRIPDGVAYPFSRALVKTAQDIKNFMATPTTIHLEHSEKFTPERKEQVLKAAREKNFNETLGGGAIGETVSMEIFQKFGLEDVRKDKEYQEQDVDFLLGQKDVKLEVKTDFASTGNLAFEINNTLWLLPTQGLNRKKHGLVTIIKTE